MSQSEADSSTVSILTRAQIAEQINHRLGGKIADTKLSGWAFDHFYQIELGVEQPEAGYEDLIEQVLDELMFADEPQFQIDEPALHALVARLGEL